MQAGKGEEAAFALNKMLFDTFERLAQTPGLGHRRHDLSQRDFYFHIAAPYFIVYARNVDPLPIIAVIHASRDVQRLLRKR